MMVMRGGPKRLASMAFLVMVGAITYMSLYSRTSNFDGMPVKVQDWIQQGLKNAEALNGQFGNPQVVLEKGVIDMHVVPHSHQTGEHPGYTEIFSRTTDDKKFFNIKFGVQESMNPNIIPHPFKNDTWVMIGQLQRSKIPNSIWFAELICDAQFSDGMLKCIHEPMILPLASTKSGKCEGDLSWFGLNVGPHDGRVFYGPDDPYIMYGSNSRFNCFGLWMQDLRMLVDWGYPVFDADNYRFPTDLQRPNKHAPVEKNWFMFWDESGRLYGHFDSTPRRSFAPMSKDGSAGRDLGFYTQEHDKKCIAKYLPKLPPTLESIHQATNSLAITLCKRSDPNCKVTNDNTFIMTLIHHKTFYDWHGEYEPYIYLFQRSNPFKLYGIIKKPLWIHGREAVTIEGQNREHTQMFYVVSMSWKNHGQKYHGYIDDPLFIAFGIEDDRPAAIDVTAGDVLQELGLCDGM